MKAWYTVPELEVVLEAAGLENAKSEVVTVRFEQWGNTVEEFVEFLFRCKILARSG